MASPKTVGNQLPTKKKWKQKKPDSLRFIRAFVDLVDGDIAAALMFSQIAYWSGWGEPGESKLRVFRKGNFWLAKSAPDWNIEIGLSKKQAYRSMKVLREKGLIHTEVMKFDGNPTVHIQTTPAGDAAIKIHSGKSYLPSKPIPSATQEKSLTDTTTYITSETTTPVDPAGEPADDMDSQEKVEKSSKEENKNKKSLPEYAIAMHWKAAMVETYPTYQKELTKKEYGQLKSIKQKLGLDTEELITYAIQNWTEFVSKAGNEKGLIATPTNPVVGFLLKYYDVAVGMKAKEDQWANTKSSTLHAAKTAVSNVPSGETQNADPVKVLAKAKYAENIDYLTGLILDYGPKNAHGKIHSYTSLQQFSNYAYSAVMTKDEQFVISVLREYEKRGIPLPGAHWPPTFKPSDTETYGTGNPVSVKEYQMPTISEK